MSNERSGVFAAGLALAIGLVLGSAIFSWGFMRSKKGDQTITVTGSARKRIRSDLVIWKAGVSYQSPVLSDAYRALAESVPRVKAYMISKGIAENQITISSISSQTLHAKSNDGEDQTDHRLFLEAGVRGSLKRRRQGCKDRARGHRVDQSGNSA